LKNTTLNFFQLKFFSSMKKIILIGKLMLMACLFLAVERVPSLQAQTLPQFVPGQALVRFTSSAYQGLTFLNTTQGGVTTSNANVSNLFTGIGVSKVERLHPSEEFTSVGNTSGMNREFVLYFSPSSNVTQIIAQLQSDPTIEVASPNHLYVVNITPNDPQFSQQWGPNKISMPTAWDIERGASAVRIAVLDAGFQLGHPDLSSKYSTFRRDETDIITSTYTNRGWQLVSGEDYTTPDNDPTGTNSHGNWVSGVAGASTNNNVGIAGVAWNNEISPIRCGFELIDPIDGLRYGVLEIDDWVRALDWVRNNAAGRVVNLSFGRPFSRGADSFEQTAINAAINAGIIICASSGNDAESNTAYPAAYPGVIAVGASTTTDTRASFSSYGSQLSLVAPGQGILTTGGSNNYESVNGTSFAAPHVAGVAALILSRNPALTPAQVKSLMERTATKVSGMNGQNFHPEFGFGRLNASQALQEALITLTIDQKLSNAQTFGTVSRWNGSSFTALPSLPSTISVQSSAEVFRGDQSIAPTNEKYQRWLSSREQVSDVINHRSFLSDRTATLTSQFAPTQTGITLRNELLDAPSISGGTVGFQDPWLVDFADPAFGNSRRNRGMDAPSLPVNSGFNGSGSSSSGGTYQGVFLNQRVQNGVFYSAQAASSQTLGGYPGFFFDWVGSNATPTAPASPNTPVVFNAANAEVRARYKGIQISSQPDAMHPTGARQYARDDFGNYTQVYASGGQVWGSVSTNFNPTPLLQEVRLSLEAEGGLIARNPALAIFRGTAFVIYEVTDNATTALHWRRFYRENNQILFGESGEISAAVGSPALILPQTGTPIAACAVRRLEFDVMLAYTNTAGQLVAVRLVFFPDGGGGGFVQVAGSGVVPTPLNISGLPTVAAFPTLEFNSFTPEIVGNVKLAYQFRRGSAEDGIAFNEIEVPLPAQVNSTLTIGAPIEVNRSSAGEGLAIQARRPSMVVNDGTFLGNTIKHLAWEETGKIGYTSFDAGNTQSAVTLFEAAGIAFSSPSIHLRPDGSPAIYFNAGNSIWMSRVTTTGWLTGGLFSNAGFPSVAVRSNTTNFLFTRRGAAPHRIVLGNQNGENPASDALSDTKSQNATESLTSDSIIVDVAVRGTMSKPMPGGAASVKLTLEQATVSGSGSSLVIEPQPIADSIQISPTSVLTLLRTAVFQKSEQTRELTATVSVETSRLAALTSPNGARLGVELIDAQTGQVLATSPMTALAGQDTVCHLSLSVTIPAALPTGRLLAARVKTQGFSNQAKQSATAVNHLTLQLLAGRNGVALAGGNTANSTMNSTTENAAAKLPTEYGLTQNYPNPFNPSTVISYQLPQQTKVRLQVFDMLGRVVADLANEIKPAGTYQVNFNASALASGTYFYRLQAGTFVQTKKMVLVK
jgi:thermitase